MLEEPPQEELQPLADSFMVKTVIRISKGRLSQGPWYDAIYGLIELWREGGGEGKDGVIK